MYCFKVTEELRVQLVFINAESIGKAIKKIQDDSIYPREIELLGECGYEPQKEITIYLKHAMC